MATRKQPELSSHTDFAAAHKARLAAIDGVRANELAEIDAAHTRANVAHEKCLRLAQEEFAAARLERTAAVVSETISLLRTAVAAYSVTRDISRAQVVGQHFRNREAVTRRVLERPLQNELGVAFAEEFLSKYPEARRLEALGRFVANWKGIMGDGIAFYVGKANDALRCDHAFREIQESLLALEARIAYIATAPGVGCVCAEEAQELWAIMSACLPGDVEEARQRELEAKAKARHIEAGAAEQALRVAAARGDAAARAQIDARGPGFLRAVLDSAGSILRMAGFSEREAVM